MYIHVYHILVPLYGESLYKQCLLHNPNYVLYIIKMFKLVTLWVKVKSLSVKLYTPKPIFENFISIIRV